MLVKSNEPARVLAVPQSRPCSGLNVKYDGCWITAVLFPEGHDEDAFPMNVVGNKPLPPARTVRQSAARASCFVIFGAAIRVYPFPIASAVVPPRCLFRPLPDRGQPSVRGDNCAQHPFEEAPHAFTPDEQRPHHSQSNSAQEDVPTKRLQVVNEQRQNQRADNKASKGNNNVPLPVAMHTCHLCSLPPYASFLAIRSSRISATVSGMMMRPDCLKKRSISLSAPCV